MRRFFQLLVFAMLAIYNAIQTVTGGATLNKLMPTGVINQGILGGFSGKVGPVVGGKWKDIDYMRGYIVPANPNTVGQQTVRGKFSALVARAREILSTILQPYWDPYYSNMSGFNAWLSENYALADSDGILDETAVMSKGTLTPTVPTVAEYTTGSGSLEIQWDTDLLGNQTINDIVCAVVLDVTGQRLLGFTTINIRATGTTTLTIETGLTATAIVVYLFFIQGTGSELIVSDSSSAICTAA